MTKVSSIIYLIEVIIIKTLKFKDFATFIQGQNRTRLSNKYKIDSFYNMENFNYDLNLLEESNHNTSLSNEFLNLGDIVLSASLFKAAIISSNHNDKVFDNNFIKVKVNHELINPFYFVYLINENLEVKWQLEKELQGTLIKRLSMKALDEIKVEIPNKEFQEKIGMVYKYIKNKNYWQIKKIELESQIVLQYLGEK